jgi:hypothetical protein
MKNNILFIGGTHGDEPIGVNALKELAKERSNFDWIIGNEPALRQKNREFEGNLNRSAPGNKDSLFYAQRRAAEILELSKKYKFVIDLHGTPSQSGIFIIITNPKKENFKLAARLPIKNVVYWPSFSSELEGPMSEFFPCGLEIECGPKNDPKTKQKLKNIIKNFLDKKTSDKKQKIFEVYDSYSGPNLGLKEFQLTKINGEKFYPVLVGVYPKITCYKMKRK